MTLPWNRSAHTSPARHPTHKISKCNSREKKQSRRNVSQTTHIFIYIVVAYQR